MGSVAVARQGRKEGRKGREGIGGGGKMRQKIN